MRSLLLSIAVALSLSAVQAQDSSLDYQHRAIAAWQQNNLVEAERLLRLSLQDHKADAATMGFLAAVLDAEQKFDESDNFYKSALAIAPRSISLLNNYGNHCAQQGDQSRAREAFHQVLRLDPHHHNANLQLAKMALDQKDGTEALRYLSVLKQDDDPAIILLRAEATSQAGRENEALAVIHDLERKHNEDAHLLLAVGMLLTRMNEFADAERVLSVALMRNPGDADTLLQLGVAAAQAGHREQAISALQAAQRLRPEGPEILSALGRTYAMNGDYPNAIEVLGEARKLAPHDKSNLLALARALDAAGDIQYAVLVYDDLVALDPGNDAFRFDRALDYSAAGRYDEAVDEFKHHIAQFPTDPQGYFRLALATEQRDSEEAVRYLGKSIDLDGRFISGRFERGSLLRKIGRLDEALQDLQISADADPENVEALSQLGGVLISLGRPQEAEKVLRTALKVDPDNRAILMHLGRALSMTGNDEESKRVLARLEALGPAPERGDQSSTVLEFLNIPPAQRLGAAIRRLQQASERRPDDLLIRIKLGNAFVEAGRVDEAMTAFDSIHSDVPSIQLAQAQGIERCAGPDAALHKLEQVAPTGRTGEVFLYKTALLEKVGRVADACDALQQEIQFIANDAQLALRASVLEVRCGKDSIARELAARAHSLPASQLVDAIALDQSGRHREADVELHRTESCWPKWGKPCLVEGALLMLRSDPEQALAKLIIAQSLGEDSEGLRICMKGRNKCDALARQTMLEQVLGPGAPESPCASLGAP
jgi:Flp pilus assembly protein TadD